LIDYKSGLITDTNYDQIKMINEIRYLLNDEGSIYLYNHETGNLKTIYKRPSISNFYEVYDKMIRDIKNLI
jgi:virulence-associated protein VapD